MWLNYSLFMLEYFIRAWPTQKRSYAASKQALGWWPQSLHYKCRTFLNDNFVREASVTSELSARFFSIHHPIYPYKDLMQEWESFWPFLTLSWEALTREQYHPLAFQRKWLFHVTLPPFFRICCCNATIPKRGHVQTRVESMASKWKFALSVHNLPSG
jgi:hypothetical protein